MVRIRGHYCDEMELTIKRVMYVGFSRAQKLLFISLGIVRLSSRLKVPQRGVLLKLPSDSMKILQQ